MYYEFKNGLHFVIGINVYTENKYVIKSFKSKKGALNYLLRCTSY